MAPRLMGATQGRRMRNRTKPRPRNRSRRASASAFAQTITITCDAIVNTKEFASARRKLGLWMTLRKFSRPTNP